MARPRGVPAAAAALLHWRADEPIHRCGPACARTTGPRSSTSCCSTRPYRCPGGRGGPPGAALHPLLGLPELLPGVFARRWACLRVGLSRPIGAILTPQLRGLENAPTLPWASSLCGACYEVCPVKIDIPSVLLHLRGRVVREYKSRRSPEALAMETVGRVFASQRRYEQAQKLARLGRGPIVKAALPGWSAMRGLPEVPAETFREWWRSRPPGASATPVRRRERRARSCSRPCAGRSRPAPQVPVLPRAYLQAGTLGPRGDPATVDLFAGVSPITGRP